ncbi:MAG: RNA polymerase sigma factor [Marinilabiliales bacterium]|nr:MAG: RNA polymerase sigma factor [Marinilabiliales bacterium]
MQMDTNRFKQDILPLKNKLYRFACSILSDTDEAQDAVQEVFMRLWNNRKKLEELNSPEAFAMTVTRNYCLDRIKARRTVSIEQTQSLKRTETGDEGPERIAEMKDTAKYLRRLMEELPEQQKAVLHMRDIEGYGFEEIGEVLDMNINAIRVNLSRARKKIRELYLNTVEHGY